MAILQELAYFDACELQIFKLAGGVLGEAMKKVIWLEGVDFSAHLHDVNDLSTQRGASLAYLHAVDWVEKNCLQDHFPQVVEKGASIGAWLVTVDDVSLLAENILQTLAETGLDAKEIFHKARETYLECNETSTCDWPEPPPFAHLSFVCGWGEADSTEEALAQAQARARAQQFRRFALRPAGEAGERFGPKDFMRPAQVKGRLPDMENELVSASLLARRGYGRYARQGFYAGMAGREYGKLFFANSFAEIVFGNSGQGESGEDGCGPDPELKGLEGIDLADSARSKLAIFYADGNDFGRFRQKDIGSRERFSKRLRTLQKELLASLLDHFREECQNPLFSYVDEEHGKSLRRLRFETLLWGGDELMFVMPSWLGLWFAEQFFRIIKKWEFEKEPLTFGAGLLICNYKTPIRVARKIVKEELAEQAKAWGKRNGNESALSVLVMESIEPMEQGLLEHLRHALGLNEKLSDALVMPADEFSGALDRMLKLKEQFPPSQLYRLLRLARRKNLFEEGRKGEIRKALKKWLEGVGKNSGLKWEEGHNDFMLVPNDSCELGKHLPLSLYWTAHLWDYLLPEGLSRASSDEGGAS